MKCAGLALFMGLGFVVGCGAGAPSEDVGTATGEVRLAPTDARCITVKTVGASTVTQSFSVSPGASTFINLSGLPLGSDTFTAQAYNVACASIGSNAATYVSDPVTATVVAGTPVNLTFQMRPAGSVGGGGAVVEFPTAHGQSVEFPIPTSGAGPFDIASGPDGALWFSEADKVGRITTTGVIKELASATPQQVAAGADGNLWFTSPLTGGIDRLTPTGTAANFISGTEATSITAGSDGNIWYVGRSVFDGSNTVFRMTPLGTFSSFAVADEVGGIASGADGNIWFTQTGKNTIGRMSTAGTGLVYFALPRTNGAVGPITLGRDGNIWAIERQTSQIVRVTTSGAVTEFAFPASLGFVEAITAGPDGNVWFTAALGISRVTPAGVVTSYATPTANSHPMGIAAGPDGAIWYTEHNSSMIGRLTP